MAIGINDGIKDFVKRNGVPPKSILLQNHGLIVAGKTPAEVATMTDMWVKACDILLGTLVAGGPSFLPEGVIDGVLSRDDTKYHREKAV
jgi:ribulose-5-phosphate 4-epimerase/fuculose-1-phosphate aldolase